MIKTPPKTAKNPGFQEAFARQKEKFSRLLKETRAHADEKNVHQLRVSTRRLRAALAIARAAGADGKFERKSQKHLKRLGKALGARRETDVLRRDLEALGLQFAGEKVTKKGFRKKLQEELARGKKFARDLERVEEHLRAEGERPFDAIVDAIRAKVAALESADYARPEDLHALRIEIKKIRYSFEIMGLPTDELKALQAILGELHDAEVLAQYLRQRKERVEEKHALAVVERRRQDQANAVRKKIRPALAATRKLLPH